MLTGINIAAYPNKKQKKTISQWLGCGRYIWNAKCEEDKYLINFAKRYLPIGTYPKIDQSFSQYKNKELSPWLFEIPSQLLRNSVSNWYYTYRQYLKGFCGKPKRKRKSACDSIHLTRELFSFEKCLDGNTRLFIGTKTKNIGYLSIKKHKEFGQPNSIYLKRKNGKYSISFCYEEKREEEETISQHDYLKQLKTFSVKELEKAVVGIDRGVIRPVQAGKDFFDYTIEQKRKKRALKLFSNSGTELSKQGVLLDKERGAINKTRGAKANRAQSYETLKKKRKATVKVA